MVDKAARKARKRLKREKKRQEIRRANSVSPYRRAAEGELIACHINDDWRERGLASIFVLREAPGGSMVLGAFLVDTWCAGLKQAWARLDASMEEYGEILEVNSGQLDQEMRRCDLEEAAEVVAGGIMFAIRNGFRLPPHYQRWTALLGDVDPQEADVSDWGRDGKLVWSGPFWDLKNRLIGCTVEQFLAREDVECVMEVGPMADHLRNSDPQGWSNADILTEVGERVIVKMLSRAETWCRAQGIVPAAQLAMAIRLVVYQSLEDGAYKMIAASRPGGLPGVAEIILATVPESVRSGLSDASDQLKRFVSETGALEAVLAEIRSEGLSGGGEPEAAEAEVVAEQGPALRIAR